MTAFCKCVATILQFHRPSRPIPVPISFNCFRIFLVRTTALPDLHGPALQPRLIPRRRVTVFLPVPYHFINFASSPQKSSRLAHPCPLKFSCNSVCSRRATRARVPRGGEAPKRRCHCDIAVAYPQLQFLEGLSICCNGVKLTLRQLDCRSQQILLCFSQFGGILHTNGERRLHWSREAVDAIDEIKKKIPAIIGMGAHQGTHLDDAMLWIRCYDGRHPEKRFNLFFWAGPLGVPPSLSSLRA